VGQDVMVTTGIPSWSGTSIVSVTPRSETLVMQMLHGSSQVPAAIGASCANCHVDAASGAYYPGVFHASLMALGAAQPSACVNCHAGAAPAGFVGPIATNPARNPGSAEMKHDAGAWATGVRGEGGSSGGRGGRCARQGGTAPSGCDSCHEGERPTWAANWGSTTWWSMPFDYGGDALGNTHGDGLDCVACHAGPGTGAWGSTQNWVGGSFAHGVATQSASTCVACHSSQRPDLNGVSPSQLPGSFDHASSGTGDCIGCH